MIYKITDLIEPDNGCEGFADGEEPSVTLILDDGRKIRVSDKLAYEMNWDAGGFISDKEIVKYSR